MDHQSEPLATRAPRVPFANSGLPVLDGWVPAWNLRKSRAERLLRGPGAGRVGDDERGVDPGEHPAREVRRQRGLDRRVGGDRGDVQQPGVVVEDGEPGRVLLPPGEVDAQVVHVRSLHPWGGPAGWHARGAPTVLLAWSSPSGPRWGTRRSRTRCGTGGRATGASGLGDRHRCGDLPSLRPVDRAVRRHDDGRDRGHPHGDGHDERPGGRGDGQRSDRPGGGTRTVTGLERTVTRSRSSSPTPAAPRGTRGSTCRHSSRRWSG